MAYVSMHKQVQKKACGPSGTQLLTAGLSVVI